MRLQGDGHVLIAQACVGFQLLGYWATSSPISGSRGFPIWTTMTRGRCPLTLRNRSSSTFRSEASRWPDFLSCSPYLLESETSMISS